MRVALDPHHSEQSEKHDYLKKKSAAVVCRDRDGNFLGSSSLVIEGVDDPVVSETIACMRLWRWHKISTSIVLSLP